MGDLSYAFLQMKSTNKFSVYLKSVVPRHFHWRFIVFLFLHTYNPIVYMFVYTKYTTNYRRNAIYGLLCCSLEVAAREIYPGLILLLPYLLGANEINSNQPFLILAPDFIQGIEIEAFRFNKQNPLIWISPIAKSWYQLFIAVAHKGAQNRWKWGRSHISSNIFWGDHLNNAFIFEAETNGSHFPDNVFKWIFLNEHVWIFIKISLKFCSQGPINNIPTMIQIMAWHRPVAKPLSEPMMVSLTTHICVTRPQCGVSSLMTYGIRNLFTFVIESLIYVNVVKHRW